MNIRVILITGGNGGLGEALARAFLEESALNRVFLGVHSASARAQGLATASAARCKVVPLDVTVPGAWTKIMGQILSEHKRLDVLVNNAGMHDDVLLPQMSIESWRNIIGVNLDGTFHGCQAVMPTMISQRSGRIVNVSSLSAMLAPPGQVNYAAAKAGVLALSQSLAKEVARIGITVNAVCPGYIDSGVFDELTDDARKALVAKIPMRRLGRPEEVASTVRFLASAEASYITGSVIKIDGGIL